MTPLDHIGRYVDLQLIGTGGFGNVYRATDLDSGSLVAIKVMNQEFSLDPAWVARFQQEASFMSQIGDHPNVVKVFDLQQEDDTFYIVMEYYSGGNLATLINKEQRLNNRSAVESVLQIAAGLSAAHAAGIVHRDIKPENILLDDDQVCKISDFGIAASTDRSIYTRIGTLYYMAPEQALGRRTDARADIYSLGITLYQMLTGALPIELEQSERPPDPRGIFPDIPERLVEILYRAIEFDADDRYQSIDELVADLDALTPVFLIEKVQADVSDSGASKIPQTSASVDYEMPEMFTNAEDSKASLDSVVIVEELYGTDVIQRASVPRYIGIWTYITRIVPVFESVLLSIAWISGCIYGIREVFSKSLYTILKQRTRLPLFGVLGILGLIILLLVAINIGGADSDQIVIIEPAATGPISVDSYYSKGKEYYNIGEYDQALSELTKATEVNSNRQSAYVFRGLSHIGLGQYERAIGEFNQAIRIDLSDSLAYHNRGYAYGELGQYQSAIEDYNETIRLEPYDTDAYYNRANSYYHLGEFQQAVLDYGEAIRIDENNIWAYVNRGISYEELGKYDQADADKIKACSLHKDYCD